MRSEISSTSSSLWLMKMTALPRATKSRKRLEQLARFGRRQHRRRLVEDQHARLAGQHAQDFDALLLAGRQVADPGARSGLEIEFRGKRRGPRFQRRR